MTDKDATTIRTLIAKYGFTKVLLELYRLAIRYADHNPARWTRINSSLQIATHISQVTLGSRGI